MMKRRWDWLAWLVILFFQIYCFLFRFRVKITQCELEKLPEGPLLLLPQHQSAFDILIIAVILKRLGGRLGYYLMKDSLPFQFLLRMIGGISIKPRSKDSGSSDDWVRKREAVEVKKSAFGLIGELHDEGEIVVIFPTGKRTMGEVGNVQPTATDYLYKRSRNSNQETPAVVIGMTYHYSGKQPGGNTLVEVQIGPLVFAGKFGNKRDLFQRVISEMTRLSGRS